MTQFYIIYHFKRKRHFQDNRGNNNLSRSTFCKVTFVFQNLAATNFDWLRIPFQSRGELVEYANSIGVVDNTLHMVNQIVLPDNQLGNDVKLQENPDNYELVYNLGGNSAAVASFYVGLCPFDRRYKQTRLS